MVLLVLILVSIIVYLLWTRNHVIEDTTSNDDRIRILVRSCSRWALASLQDTSPLIAVLHANYGAGYLWALQEIFTDSQIRDATKLDIIDLSLIHI